MVLRKEPTREAGQHIKHLQNPTRLGKRPRPRVTMSHLTLAVHDPYKAQKCNAGITSAKRKTPSRRLGVRPLVRRHPIIIPLQPSHRRTSMHLAPTAQRSRPRLDHCVCPVAQHAPQQLPTGVLGNNVHELNPTRQPLVMHFAVGYVLRRGS